MNNYDFLTTKQILQELLSFYPLDTISENSNISEKTLKSIIDDATCSDTTSAKLNTFFDKHVKLNLQQINIGKLKETLQGNTVLVDTPDGFRPIINWWNKKARQLFKLFTATGDLTCSFDHLVETFSGWVKAESLSVGDTVLTKNGVIPLTEIKQLNTELVYDFEIGHTNHRYWSGTANISSHNSGKSYLCCNILKNAQKQGAFVFVLDSEHALDTGYMSKIGMDLSEDNFMYAGVTTMNHVVEAVSMFLKDYIKAYGYDNPNAPRVLIALDSLDMLITDTENDHFEGGIQKGDQGQRAKQAKHMLRTIVSRIKRLPIGFLLTHQVYPNADITNGLGNWIVNNAVRYSASQIFLITSLKLKDGTEVTGVRMRVETYKSRFAKIGSKVEIEVPYTTGMNQYSGFLDKMEELGVVKSAGAWKKLELPGQEPLSFQTKNLDDALFQKIISHPLIQQEESFFLEEISKPEVLEDELEEV